MSDEFAHDVFLSHSAKDKAVVRAIAERLRKDGLKVWFDEWVLKPADNIPAKIEEGLEHSRVLVLCMSANAFGSDWAQLEAGTFRFRDPLNQERRFIPLRLDDAPIKGSLAQFLCINWLPAHDEQEYAKLLAAVRDPAIPPQASILKARRVSVTDMPHFAPVIPPPANAIRPLHIAEDRFLQILLSEFTLKRHHESGRSGIEISFRFDDNTPAIWDQEGKRYLRSVLSDDKCKRFQQSLDDFLLAGTGADSFEVDDPEFFFRYASGGTLPVIHFEQEDRIRSYYCFFYRDVHPIGWNIANGGSDSRAELLNPQETIHRELREELIIADFGKGERYVFPSDSLKPFDHPAHAAARRLWKRRFPNRDLNALKATPIKVDWEHGPDSLSITVGNERAPKQDGFFLNINGEDFGIEFDRVANIQLPDRVTLFDGEIDAGRLVNCPVGLFDVRRFAGPPHSAQGNYVPDFFFFGDRRCDDGSELTRILKQEFIEHVRTIRTEAEIKELLEAIEANKHCHLCPVTERIVRRYTASKDRGVHIDTNLPPSDANRI